MTIFLSRQINAKLLIQGTVGTTPPHYMYLRYASYQYSPHPPPPSSHPEFLFTSIKIISHLTTKLHCFQIIDQGIFQDLETSAK